MRGIGIYTLGFVAMIVATSIPRPLISHGAHAWAQSAPGGSFAPYIVGNTPSKREITPGNQIDSEASCHHLGGQWFEGADYKYCDLPYADGGKPCRNSRECIGHCIWSYGKSIDGRLLKKGYGVCQINDDREDCARPHFESGRIIYYKCDD